MGLARFLTFELVFSIPHPHFEISSPSLDLLTPNLFVSEPLQSLTWLIFIDIQLLFLYIQRIPRRVLINIDTRKTS